jgi:hypothetical protein
MMAGCYTLDLYCDAKNDAHGFREFPHQFFDEFGSVCRRRARQAGWRIGDPNRDVPDLCPKCNPRSKRRTA